MAVVLSGAPLIPVAVNAFAHLKDETLSTSGDSGLYSEDENIAKAARHGEPERRNWDVSSVQTQLPPGGGTPRIAPPRWTIDDSAALYGVPGWSEGYFEINDVGHVAVRPLGGEHRPRDLTKGVTGRLLSHNLLSFLRN